jgi:hypothetical protein
VLSFPEFSASFSTTTGNNVLRFLWFVKDVNDCLTSWRNPSGVYVNCDRNAGAGRASG